MANLVQIHLTKYHLVVNIHCYMESWSHASNLCQWFK